MPAKTQLADHLRRRPGLAILAATLLIAALATVLIWFQPQTLLFDRVVDEELPLPMAAESEPPTPQSGVPEEVPDQDMMEEPEGPPSGPIALTSGAFESRSRYTVSGTATVFQLEDGSRVLRLEDFSSTNGPDLFVYLTSADSADSDADINADFVDLGVLKGNVGNQNYEIADDVDLDHYDTVVIWCRRFTVGFGAADLIALP